MEGGLNLYAYVKGNPINRIDPWGLAAYSGKLTYTSAGEIAGGLTLSGTLSTKCVDGKKQVGEIVAIFFGADIGPLPFGVSTSDTTLEDNAPGRGDLNNLAGLSSILSGGVATPWFGHSFFDIQLGSARSTGHGSQKGFDFGFVGMPGWAVIDVKEVCCDK